MKKFAIVLAIVAGSVSASFAGACGAKSNKCAKGYTPGQTFYTACGSSKPACKPVCKPACAPVCKPVCKPVCR